MANFKKQSGLVLADKLRKAVLQSAIQGQLVAQNADDGLASELLAQIQAEKERLIADKVIKKEKPLADITDDEKPFDIPDSWVWVRLGDVLQINPRNKAENETDSAFVPMTMLNDGYNNSFNFEIREWGDIKSGFTHFADGDVIFAKITPCFQNRKSAIICNIPNDIGAGTTELHVLRPFKDTIDRKYILYFVKNPIFIKDGVSTFTGTAGQQRISTDFVKNYLFPLPPLAEQQRIVAKLDEILPQIDELAKSETALNALQSAFPKQMQSALLQSAISGQLTEQLESDGKASDLLTQIQAEKQRLIDDKIIKKEKPLAEITDDEKPFDIPNNWVWVRLGNVGSWNSGATPSRTKPEYYLNGTINWLKTGDLTDGVINETSEKITDLAVKESSVVLQPVGAVLMAMYGATIGKVGLLEIEATTNQACCGCKPFTGVLNWYIFYFLIANRKNFINMGAGGAQPNISKEKIVNTLIPLPPLAEQERIVAKLDALLPQVQALTI